MAGSAFKMNGFPAHAGVSPTKMAGCGPGDGCGGNFKVDKKGTVVSRALNKAGKWVKGGLDNVVSDIKKGNKKREKKRNTVKAPKNTGQGGHIVRSSNSYN